jgi:putative hemolysin
MEEILVVVACLGINALLSAFEMAFVSVPKIELRRLAREGNKIAAKVLPLRDFPERTLSVIQVGITLVGAISAAVGGAGASESIEPYFAQNFGMSDSSAEIISIVLVVIPITYLSVVIGELVPKTLALRSPAKITLLGARFIIVADKVFGPVISLLEISTKYLVKVFFPRSATTGVSSEESAVELTHFTNQHRQIMLNMASIEKKLVREFYVSWDKVVHVDMNESLESVVYKIFHSSHTRLPVTQSGIVAGVINAKEVLAARESGISDWLNVLRPAIRVSSSDTALNALKLLQEKRSHLAIVDDLAGIVTLEDISEEIFGEIYDENEDGRVKKLIALSAKTRTPKSEASG